MIALGAVATGSMKAQLELIAAGIIKNLGSNPIPTAALDKMGISSVAVAVFEIHILKIAEVITNAKIKRLQLVDPVS